jgi:hypothetical protein
MAFYRRIGQLVLLPMATAMLPAGFATYFMSACPPGWEVVPESAGRLGKLLDDLQHYPCPQVSIAPHVLQSYRSVMARLWGSGSVFHSAIRKTASIVTRAYCSTPAYSCVFMSYRIMLILRTSALHMQNIRRLLPSLKTHLWR